MSSIKPTLFNYLSAVAYLKDYFAYRKRESSKFSYESWANELGFQSRSYLRMLLIEKKKITPRFVEAFLARENFDELSSRYFEILVKYTQARSHPERESFGSSLIKLIKQTTQQEPISDHVDFVSQPFHPRLLVLLGFEDIPRDVKTLAPLIGASEAEVTAGLRILESLGLIESIPNSNQWRSTKLMFKVPDNIGSMPLASFHEKSLQDALNAFSLPREERKFQSFLLPMDADELILFHKILDDFSADLISKFRSDTYKNRRVYQINFNIFPVSKKLDSEKNMDV